MNPNIETIDGHTYRVWRDGDGNIVSKVARDTPPTTPAELTKFAYRKLFTLAERIAIDNYADSPTLTGEQKAVMRTLQFDFSIAESINLGDPDTIAGTQALEDFGLIGAGRAAQILAALPPA